MIEREIPRTDWHRFAEEFTRRHRGWLVELDVFPTKDAAECAPADDEAQRQLARGLPLASLMAVPNPHGTSFVLQGGTERRTTRVLVARPKSVRVQKTADEADVGLCIDAEDGQTTRLAFRVASRPDTTNGLAGSELGPG